MRTRILLPLILALVPAVAAAQGRQGLGRRAGEQAAPRMMQRGAGAAVEGGPAQMLLDRREELGLTDEQVSRLEGMAGEWTAAHQQIRAETEQWRQARTQLTEEQREQMQGMRERARATGDETRKGIEGLLTEEQQAQLGARFGQMGQRQGGQGIRRGNRGGGLGVGLGVVGQARRPGLAPRAQLGRGLQAQARGLQARQLQRQAVQGWALRMQLQRRALFTSQARMRRWR